MDIVERLRSVGGLEGTTRWYINPDGPEAADEIERLRAEVDSEDGKAYRTLRVMYDNRGREIERLRAELETYKDLYAAELVAKAVGHE